MKEVAACYNALRCTPEASKRQEKLDAIYRRVSQARIQLKSSCNYYDF